MSLWDGWAVRGGVDILLVSFLLSRLFSLLAVGLRGGEGGWELRKEVDVDPNTQAWLRNSLEPTFGFPRLVRFSWATVKVPMEKSGHEVTWYVYLPPSLARSLVSSFVRSGHVD